MVSTLKTRTMRQEDVERMRYHTNLDEHRPFAIVTLNWNGWKDTIELIDSIVRDPYKQVMIVVIDNASTDESIASISAHCVSHNIGLSLLELEEDCNIDALPREEDIQGKKVFIIKAQNNLGFCKGNNVGLEWAFMNGADYALVINNDTVACPPFIAPLLNAAGEAGVGLLGGVIKYYARPHTIWWAGGKLNRYLTPTRMHDGDDEGTIKDMNPYETEWISGCMMLIPKNVYEEVGGFDEDFFIWSEEWDYSIRVSSAGFKLMVVPASKICHKIGNSLGVMKPLNYYYGIRNGLMLQQKHLSILLFIPYFAYYLVNRCLRFVQFALIGRSDLARAGFDAVVEFMRGKSGKWSKQTT